VGEEPQQAQRHEGGREVALDEDGRGQSGHAQDQVDREGSGSDEHEAAAQSGTVGSEDTAVEQVGAHEEEADAQCDREDRFDAEEDRVVQAEEREVQEAARRVDRGRRLEVGRGSGGVRGGSVRRDALRLVEEDECGESEEAGDVHCAGDPRPDALRPG
jgi:hypothetical protein